MLRFTTCFILGLILVATWGQPVVESFGLRTLPPRQNSVHLVAPGDTWTALAWRFDLAASQLQSANTIPNPGRQPAIGTLVQLPATSTRERYGRLVRTGRDGTLTIAVGHDISPWQLALSNGIAHPFQPLLGRTLFFPGGEEVPRELPAGFQNLELSSVPAVPGQALAIRAQLSDDRLPSTVKADLDGLPIATFMNGRNLVGLLGTGAFYPSGDHELTVRSGDGPLWSQPWHMEEGEWTFQEITLTGEAAAIDQAAIDQERERLLAIWSRATLGPQWEASFQLPIEDYLEISSDFGARRSYNGGPYRTYHEGVDFSAFGGTPVYAPAGGTVVVAERLYVRGGAVILDHGLGIYSGYYHLSEVMGEVGQIVFPGQMVGRVGTTGLSTGNHLHWDLLVNGVWVDAIAWLEEGTSCWILAGWGRPCATAQIDKGPVLGKSAKVPVVLGGFASDHA